MNIKPIYPRKIIKQPYYLGIITGSMLGLGVAFAFTDDSILGVLLVFLATTLYAIQTKENKNFI